MTEQDNQKPGRLLITGATGGMGRTCALLAAAQGYTLVLADLLDAKLEKVAAECAGHGVATECCTLDVTRPDSIDELVGVLQQANGVDAIIHTVGVSPHMADWSRIIEIDLIGTVMLLEAARPSLIAGGCAVCIASMSAYMAPPNGEIEQALSEPLAPGLMDRLKSMHDQQLEDSGMAYAFAKKALKQYVADRAMAWGLEGKRINSISPGMINTAMGRLESDAMENFDAMRKLIALGRMGEPEDIAHTALFLQSEKAAYITGCDILVDGGFIATLGRQQRQSGSS